MTNGLGELVPDDFPRNTHSDVMKTVNLAERSGRIDSALVKEFHDAWHTFGYRYCTCAEHASEYASLYEQHGNNPSQIGVYLQERELFGFFFNGLSVTDSLSYSCYILGKLIGKPDFTESRENITTKTAVAAYSAGFPDEEISEHLRLLVKDSTYWKIKNIRNFLSHRYSPGRLISVNIGQPVQEHKVSWPEFKIEINKDTLISFREWLSNTINNFVVEIYSFSDKHLADYLHNKE